MNILLAHHAPWVGGTRTHVMALAEQLMRLGHRAVVFTDGGVLQDVMESRGIPFVVRPEGGLIPFYRQIIRNEGIELLHAHSPGTVEECRQAADDAGLPWVATIHGEYTAGFDRDERGGELARSVQAVIAINGQVRDYLIRCSSVAPAHIHVVANGIDAEEYRPGSGLAVRRELGLDPDEYVVMFLGRLETDKAQAVWAAARGVCLLRAWGVDARGVFVGGGSLYADLEAFSRENSTPGNPEPLILAGVRADVPRLIAACNVMIASGRSALEGLSVGRPVIAVGRAGYVGLVLPEQWVAVRESSFGDHGRWPDADPVETARQLYRLRFDPVLAESLGTRLREYVVRDGSARRMAERVVEVYRLATRRWLEGSRR